MNDTTRGLLAMMGTNLIWGLAPIYYKALSQVPAFELFAHRALWSGVVFAAVLAIQGRLGQLRDALADPATRWPLVLTASAISVNWSLFIWAILAGRATEASLGYFIYPLIAVGLGLALFGERMTRVQTGAIAVVVVAVGLLTWGLGAVPWVALVLATSFSIYSLVKKRLTLGPVISVTAEVLILAPFLVLALGWRHYTGQGQFSADPLVIAMLVFSGVLTAVPLILFSYATRRLRLSTVGLLQYMNPTLQFLVAVLIFAEPFGMWHAIAYPMIWAALAVYSLAAWRADRASRKASSAASAPSATP